MLRIGRINSSNSANRNVILVAHKNDYFAICITWQQNLLLRLEREWSL